MVNGISEKRGWKFAMVWHTLGNYGKYSDSLVNLYGSSHAMNRVDDG